MSKNHLQQLQPLQHSISTSLSGGTLPPPVPHPFSEVNKLQEQLVDLYLSVKIRSNEEIDNYSEGLLS